MGAPKALHRLHRGMAQRLALTLAAVAAVVCGLAALSAGVHIDQDMAALLPGGPGSPREAAQLLAEFGALDTLLVDLEVPGSSPDELADAGGRLAKRLRDSGKLADVYEGPSPADLVALGRVLLPHRLALLEDPAGDLQRHLEPTRVAASLLHLKAQLASPQAVGLKSQLLADPLGLDEELLSRLSRTGGDLAYHRGHLLSKDLRHLLLVTTAKEGGLAVNASQALLDLLAEEEKALPPGPAGPARLSVTGGPRFAAESARAVRSDVVGNFVSSGIGLLIVFLWRFRSLRLLALTSVPLGVGVLAGLAAVVATQGRIHGLSLGFGAALIGIAVDYPLHLLNRATIEPEGDSLTRLQAALDDVWASLWLGWATTAAAFAALFASRFPGLRELALFAAAGITAALFATLVLMPPLCARLGRTRPSSSGAAVRLTRLALPPGLAVVTTVAVLALSLWFTSQVRFDGELRNLDAQRPATLELHHQVLERFGQTGGSSLVVVHGADAETVLRQNDAVAAALAEQERKGTVSAVRGLASLLPSKATQAARARSLAGLDLTEERNHLDRAAAAAGFTPLAFEGFWRDVAMTELGEQPPLVPEQLAGTSLGPLVAQALRCHPGQSCMVVTTFERAEGSSVASLELALPRGAKLVDGAALAADTVAQIPKQLMLLCCVGLLANVLLLGLAYRSIRAALVATLPCVLAMLATVGLLAATGTPLNLVSASALVLVLGCGVDYGIFVLHGLEGRGEPTGTEALGVLLASGTTLAGFGTLALAQHRALQSIGVAVGLGISGSAVAALVLMPGLYRALFPGRPTAAAQPEPRP